MLSVRISGCDEPAAALKVDEVRHRRQHSLQSRVLTWLASQRARSQVVEIDFLLRHARNRLFVAVADDDDF